MRSCLLLMFCIVFAMSSEKVERETCSIPVNLSKLVILSSVKLTSSKIKSIPCLLAADVRGLRHHRAKLHLDN